MTPQRQAILDAGRPHGCNPAVFNGPCDCDACQEYDHVLRLERMERECARLIEQLRATRPELLRLIEERTRT